MTKYKVGDVVILKTVYAGRSDFNGPNGKLIYEKTPVRIDGMEKNNFFYDEICDTDFHSFGWNQNNDINHTLFFDEDDILGYAHGYQTPLWKVLNGEDI